MTAIAQQGGCAVSGPRAGGGASGGGAAAGWGARPPLQAVAAAVAAGGDRSQRDARTRARGRPTARGAGGGE